MIHLLSPDGTFDELYVSNYATLRIADPEDLTELPIGSSDELEVGDYVLAMGN